MLPGILNELNIEKVDWVATVEIDQYGQIIEVKYLPDGLDSFIKKSFRPVYKLNPSSIKDFELYNRQMDKKLYRERIIRKSMSDD